MRVELILHIEIADQVKIARFPLFLWDVSNDNCARVAYPRANKREVQDSRMYCIVTCLGLAF